MATSTRLVRQPGMIAGVCSGIATHYGWSTTLVRLLFVVFGLVGAGEIVYLVLWVLMPKA